MPRSDPSRTPDGRYIVVRGRLWRATNPNLPADEAAQWRLQLGRARGDIRRANLTDDDTLRREARRRVHEAKLALGERGPVWWTDDQRDYNRFLAKNTPYAEWWAEQEK
jgi:hypothetical protein